MTKMAAVRYTCRNADDMNRFGPLQMCSTGSKHMSNQWPWALAGKFSRVILDSRDASLILLRKQGVKSQEVEEDRRIWKRISPNRGENDERNRGSSVCWWINPLQDAFWINNKSTGRSFLLPDWAFCWAFMRRDDSVTCFPNKNPK